MKLIGGIILFGLGVIGLIEIIFDIRRWILARSWHTAEGCIVRSYIEEQGASQDDYTEKLKFKYEFIVGGCKYTGDRIRAGQELDLTIGTGPGSAWSSARNDFNRYPHGTKVRVLYDPRNPNRCCLELGGMPGIFLKLAVCICLVIIGSIMIRKSIG